MQYASEGMIGAISSVLYRQKQINTKAVGKYSKISQSQYSNVFNGKCIKPLKTEGILRKSDITHPKVEGFKK
jgi:hypothetical protein